ncbi:MAG: hypothetical protein J0I41_19725 [Filimonas sp.]|nr:hypothetical protein [Filimonas sp.]
MYSIIAGTVLLAFIHALIPNHWLPLVAVARAEKWERSELLLVSSITASAHVIGTAVLGLVLGMVGAKLAHRYDEYIHYLSPLLLIVFGLIYFSINLPHQHRAVNNNVALYQQSRRRWIILFVVIMFFSPCLEVESLFLAVGAYGFNNILLLVLVYAVISITGIISLVMLAFKGVELLHFHFIERHEKKVTGIVLIVVGIISFFIH